MTSSQASTPGSSEEKTKRTRRYLIACDPEKCDGCGICEIICSFVKTGAFDPSRSRIRVARVDHIYNAAIACRQCEEADCVAACKKAEALSLKDNVLVCDAEKCNLCCWCVEACEFGALMPDKHLSAVVACDLCPEDRIEGEPPCVVYCPKEALTLTSEEGVRASPKIYKLIGKASENP